MARDSHAVASHAAAAALQATTLTIAAAPAMRASLPSMKALCCCCMVHIGRLHTTFHNSFSKAFQLLTCLIPTLIPSAQIISHPSNMLDTCITSTCLIGHHALKCSMTATATPRALMIPVARCGRQQQQRQEQQGSALAQPPATAVTAGMAATGPP